MKKMKQRLTALFILAITFASCKKDKAESNTTLLSKQPWKLTMFIQKNLSTGAEQDAFAPMSACYKDDLYLYKSDMSFEANAGATKCNSADPFIFQAGSWRFKNNETILETTISSGSSAGNVFDYTVISITATELRMHTIQGGIDYIFVFSH